MASSSSPAATSAAASTSSSASSLSMTGDSGGGGMDGGGRGGASAGRCQHCHKLELYMLRFKDKACTVKKEVSDKIREMEGRVHAAETKAEDAQEKYRALDRERQLCNWQPDEAANRVHELETEHHKQDKVITLLRAQLDEQKRLREQDKKAVQEKIDKVKVLVAQKIKDFEDKHKQDKEEKAMLTEQVETLRLRLQALPTGLARETHRLTMQSLLSSSSRPNSAGSDTSEMSRPPVPKRPPSALLKSLHTQQQQQQQQSSMGRGGRESSSPGSPMQVDSSPDTEEEIPLVEEDMEPDYQEIDDNHQSKYEPKRHGPPQIRIERKQFQPHLQPTHSMSSSTMGSEEMLDRGAGAGAAAAAGVTVAGATNGYSVIQTATGRKEGGAGKSSKSHDHIPRSHDPRAHDHIPRLHDHIPRSHDNIPRLKEMTPRGVKPSSSSQPQNGPKSSPSSSSSLKASASSSTSQIPIHHPLHHLHPSSPHHTSSRTGADSPSIYDSQTPVTLTPKMPPTPLTSHLPNAPPNSAATHQHRSPSSSPHHHAGGHSQHFFPPSSPSHTVSALATLPRHHTKHHAGGASGGGIGSSVGSTDAVIAGYQRTNKPVPENEAQTLDRRVLYKGGHGGYGDRHGERKVKPPTPPLRKLPSVESRIYAIANVGLKLPDSGNLANRDSSIACTDGLYTEQMYQDLSVPVFTAVKGKATQIRNTPFSGESSSDSSENEESSSVGRAHTITTTSPDSETATSVAGPSGSRTTKRHTANQTSSGATKRAVSSHSVTSDSSDYALPPDDEVSILADSSGDSEPEQKLLKYTADTLRKDSLEKSGYLNKLGGKVKNWQKRWFELKHGELFYYKTPNDIARKPKGHIALDSQTRMNKAEGGLAFEIATPKRVYYLEAKSEDEADHWLRVLQNVLKKQAADRVMNNGRSREIMKGWLIKTKNGRNRRVWCVLLGKVFMYYRRPQDKTPLGQIPLRDARVEEVDRSCDSESDSDDTSVPDFTLAIWPTSQGPTYLMLPTKHEKDSWIYHLTVASGGGTGNIGTDYEQLISKLMDVDGDPNYVCWKVTVLLHTKESIVKPLTTLPSEELQNKALDLFKQCQSFISRQLDSQQIEQHVWRAQSILSTCLQQPQLQNELYCQLIRQTSRHPPQHRTGVQNFLLCGSSLCDASHPTSPTNSIIELGGESKHNPQPYVFMQGWQLLAMAVSLFLPRQSVLWYLKAHLQRNADPRTDIGKYAVFCQRALERTLHNGGREAPPSRMEVMSILLRNPYHHSQPISIPVHFLNGTYEVVSFDGSTTVQEFLSSLTTSLNMRECSLSGFALFTDDPSGQELEHCLKGHIKLCDVISKWERAYLHHHSRQQPLPETKCTVKLTVKNRLYFKSLSRFETEKEKYLLAYQVNEEVVNGRFPHNKELAVELAALMAQIEYGDQRMAGDAISTTTPSHHRSPSHRSVTSERGGGGGVGGGAGGAVGGVSTAAGPQVAVSVVVERFYPRRYRDISQHEMSHLEKRICERWLSLRGHSVQDCVRIYLTVARKWQFFGAKLFSAKVKYSEPDTAYAWLAVQEDSISILDFTSLKALSTFDLRCVVTFGGCREDLMLVITDREQTSPGKWEKRTHRLMFVMNKPKVLEITMLIASYINSKNLHRASGAGGPHRHVALSKPIMSHSVQV